MTRKNLILIHRGDIYARDFQEIAEKVHVRDPGITVFAVPGNLDAGLPAAEWRHPTLTVALTSRFKLAIQRGPILAARPIEKLAQQDIFLNHGIPTPPALPFTFGMALEPATFGEFVVLKTKDLNRTSHGDLVLLFRRKRLCGLEQKDLPRDHPVSRNPDSFMVQKYIHTGAPPRSIRVGTFFGKAIFSYVMEATRQVPPLTAPDDLLEQSVAANMGDQIRRLVVEEDTIQLAEKVHRAVGAAPLLGVDIIRDHMTGELYVLETNAGGNTWHFTSRMGEGVRLHIGASTGPYADTDAQGRRALIDQFGAFDIAAAALVAATQKLAA